MNKYFFLTRVCVFVLVYLVLYVLFSIIFEMYLMYELIQALHIICLLLVSYVQNVIEIKYDVII